MKDIVLRTQKLYFRSTTTIESTNWAVSIHCEKLCFWNFCKNAQTTLTCSIVNARLLSGDIRSPQRSKPQQFRIIARPTSDHDQLKACSDIRRRNSESGLAFPTSTLAITVIHFKYNSALRIFIRKLWAPCFVIFIEKVHDFMSHKDSSGLGNFTYL